MSQDVLAAQDLRLLSEIGMLGAGAGAALRPAAQALFQGLIQLRPARDFGYIGMACTHFNAGQADEAARVLEQAVAILASNGADPQGSDVSMVKAFLGLALLMAKRTSEALALLEALRHSSRHPPALRMAHGLLGLPITESMKESA